MHQLVGYPMRPGKLEASHLMAIGVSGGLLSNVMDEIVCCNIGFLIVYTVYESSSCAVQFSWSTTEHFVNRKNVQWLLISDLS